MKTRMNLFMKKNLPAFPAWLTALILVCVFSIPCQGYAVNQGESLPSISIELENVPARVAVATIGEKIGYRVALQSIDPEIQVSGRFTESPVDAVLTRLLKGYNLAIMFDSRERVITVQSLGKKLRFEGHNNASGKGDSTAGASAQNSPDKESFNDFMAEPNGLNGKIFSEANDPLTGQSYEEIAVMHERQKRVLEQEQLDASTVDPLTGVPLVEIRKLHEKQNRLLQENRP